MTKTLLHRCSFDAGLAAIVAVISLAAVLSPSLASAQAVPLIERIEPTSGPPGTSVTLVGRGMDRQTQILLGATPCTITARSPNRWVFTIPPNAVTGSVSARNAIGTSTTNPLFRVTAALAAPIIERLEPVTGSPGLEVVLRGQNFSPRLTDNVVTLAGRPVVVRTATPFDLHVTIPDGAVTGVFTVRVDGAGEATSAEPFVVTTGTGVTDFQPRLGPPTTRVVITGTGFSPTNSQNRVFLNNVPVRVERSTPTQLNVVIPQNAATGPLLVDVRNGGRTQTPAPFVIQYLPTITSVEPLAAPPGRQITIRGTNFGTDVRAVDVRFGAPAVGTNAPGIAQPAVVRAVTATSITVEVPPGPWLRGHFTVNVAGLGPAQSTQEFTRLALVTLSDFQPRSGPTGTLVRITGAGFSTTVGANTVTLQGTRCEVTAMTATELTVRVPMAAQSGLFEVNVANNGAARTVAAFVVTRPPTITSFSPARLTVTQDVTVNGAGFGTIPSLVEVSINGRPLQLLTLTDTQLTAKVPAGVTSGRIRVNMRMQGAAVASSDVVVDAVLAVSSFAPQSGYAGTSVVLRGEGFLPGSVVLFTLTATTAVAATPTAITPTSITVLVPVGAVTGTLSVRTADGRAYAAAGAFTITTPPTGVGVSSIEPVCTRPGCTVILRGYGFSTRNNQNRVFFGTFPARVMASTPTALTVALPRQPGTNTFRVDVRRAGTAMSAPFTITP